MVDYTVQTCEDVFTYKIICTHVDNYVRRHRHGVRHRNLNIKYSWRLTILKLLRILVYEQTKDANTF